MIRHMRGRCTQSMEDIKMMIFRQQYRIQNLHQVRYSFDALEPPFSNDLRAFYNKRRRWTTRPNFGNMQHQSQPPNYPHHPPHRPMHVPTSPSSSSNTHATSFQRYPNPETPHFPNPVPPISLQRNPHVTYSLHISGDSRNFSQGVSEWACPVTIFFSSNSLLQFFLF